MRLVNLVEERLTDGVRRYAIVEELLHEGVEVRTIDRYIAMVRDRWAETAKIAAPHVREQRIARITMLSQEARKHGKYSAAAQFERMLNEIQGVNAPERHDVRAVVAQVTAAPQVDLSQASDMMLDELERLADAQAARAPAPAGLIGDTTTVGG